MTIAIPTAWKAQAAFHLRPNRDLRQTYELVAAYPARDGKLNETVLDVRVATETMTPDGSWKRSREDVNYEVRIAVGAFGRFRSEVEQAHVIGKIVGDERVHYDTPLTVWSGLEGWLRSERAVWDVVDVVWTRMVDTWADERGEP